MSLRCINCNIDYDAGRYCPRCGKLLRDAIPPNYKTISIIIAICIALASLVSVLLLSSWGINFTNKVPTPYTETNAFEFSYRAIAEDLNLADLCYKISPNAVAYDWFKPTSERSYCFYKIAIQTHNVNLCREVKSTHYGKEITQASCKTAVAKAAKTRKAEKRGDIHYTSSSTGEYDAERILRLLGYTDDDVMKLGPDTRVGNDYFGLYLVEREKPEFLSKLSTLPDFSISDEDAKKQIYSMFPECLKRPADNPFCILIEKGLIRR
jgi:hypothetical protein